MKRHVFILLLIMQVFLSISLNAQISEKCQDILSSIKRNDSDSAGYILLNEGQKMLDNDSLKAAMEFLDCAQNKAFEDKDSLLLADTYLSRARLNYKSKQFNASIINYQNALNISSAQKDTMQLLKSLSGLSKIYYEITLADSAFYYSKWELSINKKRKDYAKVSDNFRKLYTYLRYTLGGLSESRFVTKGYLDSSLVYAKKSKKLTSIVYATTNYAVRTYVDNPKKGYKLIQEAIDSARTISVPNEPLVYALLQSYNILWKENQFRKAEDNLLEALPMALSFNKPNWLSHLYMLLGTIENSRTNNEQALLYLQNAVYYCELGNLSPLKRSVYTCIREVHRELGNIDSTLYYLEKYSILAEKAHNDAMIKQVSLLSAKFKVAEKVDEITMLHKLNKQKAEIISLQKLFLYTLIAAVIIVLTLLGFSFYHYKKTQEAYLFLTRKNTEIQKQQKEIVKINNEKRADIHHKMEPLKLELMELFEKDKIFLDKYLNLQSVASQLNTNTSYLSTLINSAYQCNFIQFLHKYRVLEACEILSREENEIYTMEAIAEMSGFTSKTAFNKAFKELTGLTPTTFRKNIIADVT